MAQALREIDCNYNHVYLIDGTRCLAYIPQGQTQPVFFSHALRFDRRGRKFTVVDTKLFGKPKMSRTVKITGSRGDVYTVNLDQQTCTCTGFAFRGRCKHLEQAQA